MIVSIEIKLSCYVLSFNVKIDKFIWFYLGNWKWLTFHYVKIETQKQNYNEKLKRKILSDPWNLLTYSSKNSISSYLSPKLVNKCTKHSVYLNIANQTSA